jgi:shikimate dehydrogenase
VLGAGGAARAVAWALREADAAEVLVWNRTPERARALADDLGIESVSELPKHCDLLVNATTVGLDPAVGREAALRQLGLDAVGPPQTVVDLVYRDGVTPACAWAAEAGSRVVGGLEVLVRQGALSLELWTGRKAPLEVMRRAARAGNGS